MISWVFTFAFIYSAWVIFRADSLAQAMEFFRQLGCFSGLKLNMDLLTSVNTGGFDLFAHFIPARMHVVPIGLFVFAFFSSVFMKNTNQRISAFQPSFLKE